MSERATLDLPVLLPEVGDPRDECVEHLCDGLRRQPGVRSVRVVDGSRTNGHTAQLALEYDPVVLPFDCVERIAQRLGADIRAHFGHALLRVGGMRSPQQETVIELTLRRLDGVLAVSASFPGEAVRVEYDTRHVDLETIVARLKALGLRVAPEPGRVHRTREELERHPALGDEPARDGHAPTATPTPTSAPARAAGDGCACCAPRAEVEPDAPAWRRHLELIESLTCGAFLLVGWVLQLAGQPVVSRALLLVSCLIGIRGPAIDSVRVMLRGRFDIDVLMVVAAVGAAILGHWAEAALLLFLFSLGHAGEHMAMARARSAIRALQSLAPDVALLVRSDDSTIEVPVETLSVGDVVLARPGDRIAADGRVERGESAVDQSPITGESMPADKEPGDDVFAGTINGDGALHIRVTRPASENTLARVIRMVEEAQTEKSPTEVFTDTVNRYYVPSVLGATALTAMLPPLLAGAEWATWFYRSMAFVTASAPCAVAIGTPAAVLSGLARAARGGVLIKGGAHLENLGRVRAIALDKTGTLTKGEPRVTDVVALNGTDEARLLAVAAATESGSSHPLGEAVMREADRRGLARLDAADVEQLKGFGVRAMVEGVRAEVGNARMFGEELEAGARAAAAALEERGRTTMLVRHDGTFLGVLGVADEPRPQAAGAIAALREAGIEDLILLTGDNERSARAVCEQLGIDRVEASLLPEDKADRLRALRREYGRVAMVGDGVNDAPAMAAATIGIAMGTAGTDVALETADVALMGDDLSRLPFAIDLSRRARRIIVQNLVIALGVIVLLAPSAILGFAPIGLAVVFHEGSTVVVVLNSLRLLK